MSTRLHAKTEQEAHQRGGEIPSRRAEDLAGVMVKGEHLGQAMRAQKLGHHLARELRHRNCHAPGGATRSRCQHRRSWRSLPHVAACPPRKPAHSWRLSDRTGRASPGCRGSKGLGLRRRDSSYAACLAKDLPDGGLLARQAHTSLLECRVAMHIREDRFWSWNTLHVFRRRQADLQDTLHDGWLGGDGGRWRVPRS
jgi:hypothetical protein